MKQYFLNYFKKHNNTTGKLKAFTLIELLVVIGIIGIVSTIGIVSFGAVRKKARRSACIATLRSNFNSDENLVAYWNFDEGPENQICTTAKDFWGNNGVCKPTAATDAPKYTTNKDGIIDYALSFDGVNDYIVTPYGQGIDPSVTKHSYELWVKSNQPASSKMYLSQSCVPSGAYFGHRALSWDMGIDTSNWGVVPLGPPADTDWHHIVIVFDGSAANFYDDGNWKYKKDYSSYTFNQNLVIGAYQTTGSFNWQGLIDEVILYNRALSADEIASHYKACKK